MNLPINSYRQQILSAIQNNPVTIITAATGAGKSTGVPQFLLEAGYKPVVTQLRRLAASSVAERVAEERGEKLGDTVGYRTAVDRKDSPNTQVLFCTDGLALVRELMGQGFRDVLVLDEVHEWNENVEVLVSWVKQQIEARGDFKVVLMSATLESEKLSDFFGGAPVIEVPGRLYPVEERSPQGETPEEDVASLVREGRNVLMFQPGTGEIQQAVSQLQNMELDAEILPLHGQLEKAEQNRCFAHFSRPKVVVSTNVAQTSLTIDDIDAVVDTGEERRKEVVNGVEGIYLRPISFADAKQRRGRAGRTKPGIYVDWCTADPENRPEFPVAEIHRKRLDQTVLRLAMAGFDMAEMEFFHQPDIEDIRRAKTALISLGCMTSEGEVTEIGKQVNRLPISVHYARMILEAAYRGVLDDVLTIAAILEMDGITVPTPSKNRPDRPDWRRLVEETESDLLAQLQVWHKAPHMSKEECKESGVSLKDLNRARQVRKNLVKGLPKGFTQSSSGDRAEIMKSIAAGLVDSLYQDCGMDLSGPEGEERKLSSSSVITPCAWEWVVGKPFDLQIKARGGGRQTLNLLEMATRVKPEWLAEVAPQLYEEQTGLSPRYKSQDDVIVSVTKRVFNGRVLEEVTQEDPDHPEAPKLVADWLAGRSSLGFREEFFPEVHQVVVDNDERQREARELNRRADFFHVYTREELADHYEHALGGARCLAEIADADALRLPGLDTESKELLQEEYPDTITLLGTSVEVKYGRNRPYLFLPEELSSTEQLIQLPEEGLFLPSGEQVEVFVPDYGHYLNLSELKSELEADRAQHDFQAWKDGEEVPELSLPDTSSEESEIPFTEVIYGYGLVSGNPLYAWGTLRTEGEEFFPVWYMNRDQAVEAYENSRAELERIQARLKEQREFEELNKEVHQLRDELSEETTVEGWENLDENLRYRVFQHLEADVSCDGFALLRKDKEITEHLLSEVEDAWAETTEENEESTEEETPQWSPEDLAAYFNNK